MINIRIRLTLFALAGLVATTVCGQGATTLKSFKITIDGTSTMHDWTSDVTKVEWQGSVKVASNKISEIKGVKVNIPVTSIKSTKGNTMDKKTYEAFKSKKFPSITYQLSKVTVVDSNIKASGSLTMAGATKPVDLQLTGTILPSGDVQLKGSQKLNMQEYQLEPPREVMGTIKVGPEVTVKFDLIVAPTN